MDAAQLSAREPALELPFDADAMLAGLRRWVECESPTHDAAAVNRMMALAARDLAIMGATVETIPGRMAPGIGMLGDCVRARFPHESREPGILILAHLDTVHPVGTLATGLPFRREGDKAYGPGIQDMKGGTYLAVEAIGQLLRAGIPTSRPVTVLLTPDEEVGTPSTRDIIEAEAARHAVVLVPEPARPDGGVVTGRYAIARFNLRTTGRPSHAGARLSEGRSAIREMAKQILAIEEMTTEDCTFSIGVVHAGQWVNCVATHCDAEALSMAKRQEDLDAGVAKMLALRPTGNDVQLAVTRGVTRPVWEPDAKVMALHATAERIAKRLGFPLPHQSSGGGSDGNFTGAMGIPTLDGLGVQGAMAHTLEEHIIVPSLAARGKLFAGLLQVV
ncbi:MAG: M20/M25/M40 family metallo-hydrolase [Acetobacteraceae bacterium]|nr:M20/M25/M40 family metallo-hydrolase [Acetobacteraceae bacterium]